MYSCNIRNKKQRGRRLTENIEYQKKKDKYSVQY